MPANWKEYDRYKSFPFDYEPNKISFGSKLKGKLWSKFQVNLSGFSLSTADYSFGLFDPHQYSSQNKKLFEKLTNRRCLWNKQWKKLYAILFSLCTVLMRTKKSETTVFSCNNENSDKLNWNSYKEFVMESVCKIIFLIRVFLIGIFFTRLFLIGIFFTRLFLIDIFFYTFIFNWHIFYTFIFNWHIFYSCTKNTRIKNMPI